MNESKVERDGIGLWKAKCPNCESVNDLIYIKPDVDKSKLYHECKVCKFKESYKFWECFKNEQSNELPISMANTVISKPEEKEMLEMVDKAKKQRVDHKKEWYVKECGRLENELWQYRRDLQGQEMLNAYNQGKIRHPSIRFALGLLVKAVKDRRW